MRPVTYMYAQAKKKAATSLWVYKKSASKYMLNYQRVEKQQQIM